MPFRCPNCGYADDWSTTSISHRFDPIRVIGSRVFWRGRSVSLSKTSAAMVVELVVNAPLDVTYMRLYQCIQPTFPQHHFGPGKSGWRSNVRTAMKRVRSAFRDVDPDFDRIENKADVGYRWCQPNQVVSDPESSRSSAAIEPECESAVVGR